MPKKEELTERVARIETKIERCEVDIFRLETRMEDFKKEVKQYIDDRGKEISQQCIQEHDNKNYEKKKTERGINISRGQLITAIIVAVVLVIGLILQWIY